MIAEVALAASFLPRDIDVLDYLVPDAIQSSLCVGGRVFVPLGKRTILGFVVKIKKSSAVKKKLRPIYKSLDTEPVLSAEFFDIARKIQSEYLCGFGEAAYSMLPFGLKHPRKEKQAHAPSVNRREISSFVLSEKEEKIFHDTQFSKRFLLLSDTGNKPKWEIYASFIKSTLNSGKSVIFLLPDYKKIKPALDKLNLKIDPFYFSSMVSAQESLSHWHAVKKAPLSFVIGTRSAVFAPVNNLGLIIIEEEDHFAYRQEQFPYYITADIAFWRAQKSKAKIVLGCFIPSLETYSYQLSKTKSELAQELEYLWCHDDKPWPVLKLVDLHRDKRFAGPEKIISKVFEYHIADCLQKKEKILIFVNRKGFSTFLYCKKCEKVQTCPRCSASLTYFQQEKMIVCPICQYKTEPFEICHECKSSYIKFFGYGIQKVESEVKKLFPSARTIFLDKPIEDKALLSEYDIILATQQFLESSFWHESMFDSVCIMSCDEMLSALDFRSTEKAFLKLTRLGRIAKKSLCVQTRMSGHYIFKYLKVFDMRGFYAHEFKLRRELKLPPYRRMGVLMVRSHKLEELEEQSRIIFEELQSFKVKKTVFSCSEPVPCVPLKARGKYRFQIFFKYSSLDKIRPYLRKVMDLRRRNILTVINTNIF